MRSLRNEKSRKFAIVVERALCEWRFSAIIILKVWVKATLEHLSDTQRVVLAHSVEKLRTKVKRSEMQINKIIIIKNMGF